MRGARRIAIVVALTVGLALAGAAPAAAAAVSAHVPLAGASIFGSIAHAVLGAFSWTIGLASRFILTTIGALVRMLIPRSWASEGVRIMEWIVAVPNYAGTVTTPAGTTVYGFGGINALRDLFTWIGVGLLPLTLMYGTTRAMLGQRGPVAVPLVRVLGIAGVLVSYPYWWTQAAAMTDTVTHLVLGLPRVTNGLHELMLYAVDGVALGGWQLVDLALMALVAIELLSLIFLKVVIILLGALLYASGPVTIGLVATEAGAAIARAWVSAVALLIALPVVWALLFAIGALLVGDAGTAGPLIAGNSAVGSLLGGVLLAVAGAASLWLCLKAAREAMGLLRMQLGGLLALSHRTPSSANAGLGVLGSSSVSSLRRFGARVAQAAAGAAGELAAAGPAGAAVVRGGRAIGYVGRRGVIGTAAAGSRAATAVAAPQAAALVGRSRAGAVAVRMAKAGTAGWYTNQNGRSAPPAGGPAGPAGARGRGSGGAGERSGSARRAGSTAASRGHAASSARPPSDAASLRPRPTGPPAAPPVTRPGAPAPRAGQPRAERKSKPAAPPRRGTPPPRGGSRPGRGKR
jgi:hypothetical protein